MCRGTDRFLGGGKSYIRGLPNFKPVSPAGLDGAGASWQHCDDTAPAMKLVPRNSYSLSSQFLLAASADSAVSFGLN